MKVCFLDVDGVLNSQRTAVALGMGYPEKMVRKDDPRLDPVAIGLLMKMVIEFDFKIVLSSTWRIGFSEEDVIEMWQDSMLRYYGWTDFPIIGYTRWAARDTEKRGHEIRSWLEAHPEVEDYIIVDDDADMLPEQIEGGHFHHVNSAIGLDYNFVEFCYARQNEKEMRRIIGV